MATADTTLLNHLYSARSLKPSIKCLIEYNMNSMIKDITVTSTGEYTSNGTKPYKKLFPAESVIQPFRPVNSGAKYYIYTASGQINPTTKLPIGTGEPGVYQRAKDAGKTNSLPRLYFAGGDNVYKYWISAINTNATMKITYPKFVLTNKVVVKFEKFHEIPSACTITLKYSDLTTSGPISATPNANGESIIYYGSSWSTSESSLIPANSKKVLEVSVAATNKMQDRVTAIIEVSPRLVRDISGDVTSFSITKESSNSGADGILPVGSVTANSLSLNLAKYNNSSIEYLPYDDAIASPGHLIPEKNYLTKNAQINISIVLDVDGVSKVVPQGTYFINEYSRAQFGEVTIQALDGAKYLQETLMPNLYLESYPTTSVLKAILDNVGMTNYNFNTTTTATAIDNSIGNIKYFSTDDSMTVWDTIQQICMDTQMNAFFDDNNVLQFYTRNYIYDSSRLSSFSFYAEDTVVNGTTRIPNILTFSKREIPSTNQVIIRWQVPQITNQANSAAPVWQSPVTFLGGGGLLVDLQYPQSKTQMRDGNEYYVVNVVANVSSAYGNAAPALYQFSGYLMIESEIIEYDAIGYEYRIDSSGPKFFWATSQVDVDKYRAMVPSVYGDMEFFKPVDVYRIKTNADGTIAGRGALGTTPVTHYVRTSTGWVDSGSVVIK